MTYDLIAEFFADDGDYGSILIDAIPAQVWALAEFHEPDLEQQPGLCIVIDELGMELVLPLDIIESELGRIGLTISTADLFGEVDCESCGGPCMLDAEYDEDDEEQYDDITDDDLLCLMGKCNCDDLFLDRY